MFLLAAVYDADHFRMIDFRVLLMVVLGVIALGVMEEGNYGFVSAEDVG